jgi:hypothetical protein
MRLDLASADDLAAVGTSVHAPRSLRARKLAAVACLTFAILGCSASAASADPWGADRSPSSYGDAGWGSACWNM